VIERRHYYISGSVQGVGFRYRAVYAARGLGITGYVRNLYDGRVEMEVQGDRDSISRMLGEIDAGSFIHIDDLEMEKIPVIEEERDFKVKG
jgi:acylphosphatase